VTSFERRITAAAGDIDGLGHVNNAVWVRWIQDMATTLRMVPLPAAPRQGGRGLADTA
jgi:acyl-CoA thioesterase FadM